VDGITQASLVSAKLGGRTQGKHQYIVLQKYPGPTFLKLRSNAVNLSCQCLNHHFINLTAYCLFSQHKLIMIHNFSIKTMQSRSFSATTFVFSGIRIYVS
jgi:hypothetical protein